MQGRLRANLRRQKKNYDRRATDPLIKEGEFVWLFNPLRRKGVCNKLGLKWKGPYLVLRKLSDVVYRIQRARGAKRRVVHVDRLKPYQGDPLDAWNIPMATPVEEIEALEVTSEEVPVEQISDPEVQETVVDNIDAPLEGVGTSLEEDDSSTLSAGNSRPVTPLTPSEPDSRYPKRAHKLPLRYR